MIRAVLILSFLSIIFSCKTREVDALSYSTENVNIMIKDEAVLLKKENSKESFYHVLQSSKYIYLIQESFPNDLSFYFEELGCSNYGFFNVLYLKRFESKTDLSKYYTYNSLSCEKNYYYAGHGESPEIMEKIGAIYKVKNDRLYFVKRGNIMKETRKDKIFWLRKIRIKEPIPEQKIKEIVE